MSRKNSCGSQTTNDEQEKKVNKSKNAAKETFNEWCDASTIHGIRYIGSGSCIEKTYWFLIIVLSTCICIFQIRTAYIKWRDNALSISYDERVVAVKDIPFPAITICNNRMAINTKPFYYDKTFLEIYKNGTENVDQIFLDIYEVLADQCVKPAWSGPRKTKLLTVFKNTTLKTENVDEIFKNVRRNQLLIKCSGIIKNSWWPCTKGFTPILTPTGMCWTFNMLNKNDLINDGIRYYYGENDRKSVNWDLDDGYLSSENVYPIYTKNIKKRLGVLINYKYFERLIHECRWKTANIYVHHPADLPYETKPWEFSISTRKITIIPEILLASKDIKSTHTPEARNCYFQGERQLAFFKTYTQVNCQVECITNKTIETCGCAHYWMPGYNATPICGIKNYECYTQVTYKFGGDDEYCDCKRLCNKVIYNYDREILSTDFLQINFALELIENLRKENETKEIEDASEFDSDASESNFTNSRMFLWIQFSKPEYLAMRMSAQFSLTDFISQCGGLLGLFMGVSILSIIEMLYYFTVKLIKRIWE